MAVLLLLAPLAASADDGPRSQPDRPGATADPERDRGFSSTADTARDQGPVRLLVGLDVAFTPEGELSPRGRSDQRAEIARTRGRVLRALRGSEHRLIREYVSVPAVALELSEEGVERLRDSGDAVSVHEDEVLVPMLADSGPLVEADLRHGAGNTGAGQAIAILDSGVDAAHPTFGDRVVAEACFSGGGQGTSVCPNGQTSQFGEGAAAPCQLDGCWHGTHVAGIAAGADASRTGVAPAADVIAVQVFSESEGELAASLFDVVAGLDWVHQQTGTYELAAANLSLGTSTGHSAFCDPGPAEIKASIDNLRSVGTATVVATGNNHFTAAVSAPACVSTAIAVGSTTKSDTISAFSNGHPGLVDLLAPGSSITSSIPGGAGTANGTSMAAPHVAGAWALLRELEPDASVETILRDLQGVGRLVSDERAEQTSRHHSHRRIRLHEAATAVRVGSGGDGHGRVVSEPAGIDCGVIACATSLPDGETLELSAQPHPGSTFVGWDGACTGSGTCEVSAGETERAVAVFGAQSLDNDTFATATVVEQLPYARSQGDVFDAVTDEANEPGSWDCDDEAPPDQTVWFRHTPDADGTLSVDTVGSNYDTVLTVYIGSSLDDLQQQACDFGTQRAGWTDSQVRVPVQAGTTYHVQVGAFAETADDLRLRMGFTPIAHPRRPASVGAVSVPGAAEVCWTPPASGSEPDAYTITVAPDGRTLTVPGDVTSARMTGIPLDAEPRRFTVVASNRAGNAPVSGSTGRVVPYTDPVDDGSYVALPPERVLDTRGCLGGVDRRIGAGETIDVDVTGRGGVPAGAEAVVINATAIAPTQGSFLTVFPVGESRPVASSINFPAGRAVNNLLVAPVGDDGKVEVYNDRGQVHVTFDVMGYLPEGTEYGPLSPARILNTRNQIGDVEGKVGPGQTVSTSVTEVGGVPADAEAVVINVTAAAPTHGSFLTVFPSGASRPLASSVNFPAGRNVGNLIVAPVGDDGKVEIYNDRGEVDVIFDVVGFFPEGSEYGPLSPARIFNTRNQIGDVEGKVGPGQTVSTSVTEVGGVPADAEAVVINVTAAAPTHGSFLTVFPSGASRPLAATVNFPAGETVGNMVVAAVGDDGKVEIYNDRGEVDVIFDVVGFLPRD